MVTASTEAPEAPKFGPFDPPRSFVFPNGLDAVAPRPRPSGYFQSSHVRRWRQHAINMCFCGTACVAISDLPFIKQLGWFFTPFAYLLWIGLALIAAGILMFVYRSVRDERLMIARRGEPRVARVTEVGIRTEPIQHGQVHRFAIACEVRDPKTSVLDRQVLVSPDQFTDRQLRRTTLSLNPGDYTTVMVMPNGKVHAYALLGIDPSHEVVLRDGRPIQPISALRSLLIAAGCVSAVLLVFGGIFAVMFLFPAEDANLAPAAIAMGIGLVGALVATFLYSRKNEGTQCLPRKERIVRLLGISVLGAVVVGILALIANASFDFKPGSYRGVEITGFTQTTHHGLFRDYSMKYRPVAGGKSGSNAVMPETMLELAKTMAAVMEQGEGGLGMKWVRAVHPPLMLRKNTPGLPSGAPDIKVVEQDPQGQETHGVRVLCFRDRSGVLVAPPPELARWWLDQERAQGPSLIPVDSSGQDIRPVMEFSHGR